MSFNFSESEGRRRDTQQVYVPPADPNERELRRINVEIARMQQEQLQRAMREEDAFRASPQFAAEEELRQRGTQNLLDRLTGRAPVLSPEAQTRLDTVYGRAQRQGEEDLMRFGEDIAAQRGMTPADSPIGNELLRQRRLFGESLAAQRAGSALDIGSTEANFNTAVLQFQDQLRQQALANRMAMAGLTPAPFGLQTSLFGERLAQAPRSGRTSMTGSQWGAGLSGSDVYGYGRGIQALGYT